MRVHGRTPLLRSEGFGISIDETADACLPRSVFSTRSWPNPLVYIGVLYTTVPAKLPLTGPEVAENRVSRQNIVATLAAKAAALRGK